MMRVLWAAFVLLFFVAHAQAQTPQYVTLTNSGSVTVSAGPTELYLDSGSASDTFSSFTINLPQPTTGSNPPVEFSIKSTRPIGTLTIVNSSPDNSPIAVNGVSGSSTITNMSVNTPYGVVYANGTWFVMPGSLQSFGGSASISSNIPTANSVQYATVTNGGSLTVNPTTSMVLLNASSASPLSSYTLNLPSVPALGNSFNIRSTRLVGSLSLHVTSPDTSGIRYGGQTSPTSTLLDVYHPQSITWTNGGTNYWNVDPAYAYSPFLVQRPCGTAPTGSGVVYYVNASTGSDGNNGTSPSTPFATVQKAANTATVAGDVVEVYNGTYTGTMFGSEGSAVIIPQTNGTATAPLTFEAACGQSPVLSATGSEHGIMLQGQSYIVINGFEIAGVSTASNQSSGPRGITLFLNGSNQSHHDTIEFNKVHNFGDCGICAYEADYISVLYNTTYENAYWDQAGDSGINFFGNQNFDTNTSTYRNYVVGNTSYLNMMLVLETPSCPGTTCDGNGIIFDTFNSGYTGKTLVANNLAFYNGGSGMHACGANNIDFFFNTAYDNDAGVTGTGGGQIFSGCGSNTGIRVENNIMAEDNGTPLSSNSGGTFDYNLQFGTGSKASGTHDVTSNPNWVSATSCTTGLRPSNPTACLSDAQSNDFHLQATSPAINSANSASGFTYPTDIVGTPRPTNGGYDMGAYQFP